MQQILQWPHITKNNRALSPLDWKAEEWMGVPHLPQPISSREAASSRPFSLRSPGGGFCLEVQGPGLSLLLDGHDLAGMLLRIGHLGCVCAGRPCFPRPSAGLSCESSQPLTLDVSSPWFCSHSWSPPPSHKSPGMQGSG